MQIDDFAADPTAQFFQTTRKQQRSYSFFSGAPVNPEEAKKFVDELDQAYKLYLGRIFRVPTFYWSQRKILNDIKKHYRTEHIALGPLFRKGLAELSRAQKADGQMLAQDCIQLSDLIQKQVDQIDAFRKAEQNKRARS